MNYEDIIEFENMTLQDCEYIYNIENIYAQINDGRITDMRKEETTR